ncbi:hypothetical protein DNU06_02070 [Putridiphycobacter roseus]|uniref:Glycosyl transferase family 1 domain-containing protein n=1 Tax=Putridiphycobacter roseus TaxID=2219161 RepID=A0A2W1N1X8_9FLAO|nr:glycosyltransferase [Putridiphycobacter roseus]PZE18639.1 hypothetical protein DNU06_02070 [Putridiphycobacter roseus]
MKILHLPYNIASFATITVNAINQTEHQAKGLILTENNKLHNNSNLTVIPPTNSIFNKIKRLFFFVKAVLWADVIHWYYDEKILKKNYALRFIKWLKKPAIVEWLGTDIRNPLIEFEDNPYFKAAYPLFYALPPEKIAEQTTSMQRKFAEAGFETALCSDMQKYIVPDVFNKCHVLRQRIAVKNLPKNYPLATQQKPVLVHAPSKKDVKGTHFVLKAIETLKAQNLSFEFKIIHNQTHEQAIEAIQNCDIFIDQFIIGGYGMAAIEAMAFGKPVIAFIKEANWTDYPASCPIINTKGEDLATTLKILILNGQNRNKIGIHSRAYVEQFHDTAVIIPDLLEIYKKVIDNK